MRYRQFRERDSKEWLDVLFGVDGDEFSIPATSHLADVAKGYGAPEADLQLVEGSRDRRTGPLVSAPALPISPTDSERRRSRAAELQAIPYSNWTSAQMRELIDLMAQELGR